MSPGNVVALEGHALLRIGRGRGVLGVRGNAEPERENGQQREDPRSSDDHVAFQGIVFPEGSASVVTERGIHVVREHLAKLPPANSLTTEQRRAQYDRAERVFPTPADVAIERVKAPERPAEWLQPPGVRADAVAAYQWLLGQGIAPGRVVLAGDSAGGGLTVATLVALRDRGLPRPAAGVCISPWVDLTCSGASYATKATTDPIVTRDGVTALAQAYVGHGDPKTPLASPLFADLRHLPPLLVQVGSEEVLLDDARRLGARARTAGVEVTVEEWPAMVHVWHWFLPMLDEAEHAVGVIGDFVRARIG